MRLQVGTVGKTALVNLHGALTVGRPVEDLTAAVSTLLAGQIRDIRLNVTAVPYADASGLGALVACHAEARASDCTLRVEGARGKLEELMGMTRLDCLGRPEVSATRPSASRARPASRRSTASPLPMLAPRVA